MAMESDSGIAMTVAMDSGHSAHAMHDRDMASEAAATDCEHCPPVYCETAASCSAGISAGCQTDVKFGLDSRRVKLLLEDAQFDVPATCGPTIGVPAIADHDSMPSDIGFASRLPGYHPPLNLLNCVYLI